MSFFYFSEHKSRFIIVVVYIFFYSFWKGIGIHTGKLVMPSRDLQLKNWDFVSFVY